MSLINRIANNFVHSEKLAYTAIRSTISAQVAGWMDFGFSFAMFSWVGLAPVYATAIGAVMGGLTNCIINYKFTYPSQECAWNIVIVKFIMVWFGGLLLNSFGTQFLYWVLNRWEWLATIGFKPDGYFTAARLSTALIVSVLWHFLMQRYFVYRHVGFDKYAEKISFLVFPGLQKHRAASEANISS
ncbi:MAG: GtrA family protein [Muribaculaceae bacterium]|nr:GtrA family protein [Muribaculaceae bacterium]